MLLCGTLPSVLAHPQDVAAAEDFGFQPAPVGPGLHTVVDEQLHRVYAVAGAHRFPRRRRREHEVVHAADPGAGVAQADGDARPQHGADYRRRGAGADAADMDLVQPARDPKSTGREVFMRPLPSKPVPPGVGRSCGRAIRKRLRCPAATRNGR